MCAPYPRTDGTLTVLGPAEEVLERIYVVKGLFKSLPGIHFPTYMVILHLSDDTLLIYSPFNPDLVELPSYPVSVIIAPNATHGTYAQKFHKAHSGATLYSSPSLKERFPDQEWGNVLSETQEIVKGLRVKTVQSFMFKEVVMLHEQSGTLIGADLAFNFTPKKMEETPWATRAFIRMMNGTGKLDWSTTVRALCRSGCKEGVKELDEIIEWQWDRFLPCHGEIVHTGAKEAFKQGTYKYVKDVAEGTQGGASWTIPVIIAVIAVLAGIAIRSQMRLE